MAFYIFTVFLPGNPKKDINPILGKKTVKAMSLKLCHFSEKLSEHVFKKFLVSKFRIFKNFLTEYSVN